MRKTQGWRKLKKKISTKAEEGRMKECKGICGEERGQVRRGKAKAGRSAEARDAQRQLERGALSAELR